MRTQRIVVSRGLSAERGRFSRVRLAALTSIVIAIAALLAGMATAADASWEPAQPVDNQGADASYTYGLSAGRNGLATALFEQSQSGTLRPFAIRRAPGDSGAWGSPYPVTSSVAADNTRAPSLASADDGSTVAVFRSSASDTPWRATSWPQASASPGAATVTLCTSGPSPQCAVPSARVAVDGNGNAYAVGATNSDTVLFAQGDADSGVWQPATVIANDGSFPRIAVDPSGDAVIIYYRTDAMFPNPGSVHAKRKLAGESSFGTEYQLSGPNSVHNNNDAALVIDGDGTATAAFAEDVLSASPTNVVRAVRWPLADAAPEPEQQIGAPQDEGDQSRPALAVDPQGRVTAVWLGAKGPLPSQLYSAQFAGGAWSAPEAVCPVSMSGPPPPCSQRAAGGPSVAVDTDGTATLVYVDNDPPQNNDNDVKAVRKKLGGVWSTPVSLRSAAAGAGAVHSDLFNPPSLASGFAGQADAVFLQELNGVNHVFATRYLPDADLLVDQLSDSPDPVAAGRLLTYSATVANDAANNEGDAGGVVVTDELPASVQFVSASASQGSCSTSGQTVSCQLGTLGAGNAATVTILVRPQEIGAITNTVTVSGAVHEVDSSNNTATVQTNVAPTPPVGASPLVVPLVPAFTGCSSANSQHGAPLNFGSCNPAARASSTAEFGTKSNGFAELVACPVGSAVPQCNVAGVVQPDMRLFANLRDVRCVGSLPSGCSAGADYNPNGSAGPYTTVCTTAASCGSNGLAQPYCASGVGSSSACIANTDLTFTARHSGAAEGKGVRITDTNNGANHNLPATTVDSAFPIPMDCLPTPSNATIGSTCAVNTSANALAPGAVRTGDMSMWQLGEIEVLDSGPDGTRGNSDDERLAVQGIYVP
jgi:uncharacterized repeat protein (TIGR01451 family)